MRQTEQSGGDCERCPTAGKFLDPAKQYPAEQQLLHERGEDSHADKVLEQLVRVSATDDVVDVEQRGDADQGAEQQEPDE